MSRCDRKVAGGQAAGLLARNFIGVSLVVVQRKTFFLILAVSAT